MGGGEEALAPKRSEDPDDGHRNEMVVRVEIT